NQQDSGQFAADSVLSQAHLLGPSGVMPALAAWICAGVMRALCYKGCGFRCAPNPRDGRDRGEIVNMQMGKTWCAFATASVLSVCLASATGQQNERKLDLTPVKPETVGFSSERLERLHTLMREAV